MKEVQKGDTVHVHYTGKLPSGELFDTSEGREPLEFVAGSGQVIPGFDNAVIGMKEGDKKNVHIPVAEAYGDKSDEMIMEFPRSNFPEDITPEEGMELHMNDDQGNVMPVIVTKVGEEFVTLDANHPLAGHDLIFDLEMVKVVPEAK